MNDIQAGQWFYHGTLDHTVPKILRHGLQARKSKAFRCFESVVVRNDYDRSVFITTNELDAAQLARFRAEQAHLPESLRRFHARMTGPLFTCTDAKGTPVVLRFKLAEEYRDALLRDEEWNMFSFRHEGPIPAYAMTDIQILDFNIGGNSFGQHNDIGLDIQA